MAYDVFGAQTRKTGEDAALVLSDSKGFNWSVEVDGGDETIVIKRNGVEVLTIADGAMAFTGGLALDGGLAVEGGSVILLDLPTADPEVEGALYVDTGVLMVSAGSQA